MFMRLETNFAHLEEGKRVHRTPVKFTLEMHGCSAGLHNNHSAAIPQKNLYVLLRFKMFIISYEIAI